MKKFVGLTMAAVCALTACAFGLTGCNKISDVVTEEEWIAAMSAEKALNATMKLTGSSIITTKYNGVTETETASGTIEAKTALSKIDAESSENWYNFTGNMYLYMEESEESSEENYKETTTMYVSSLEDSFSYVLKRTETDEDDYWYGEENEDLFVYSNDTPYYFIRNYLSIYEDSFENFEYSEADGAYVTNDDGVDVYIKIIDGYLTSMVCKGTVAYTISENYSYEVTLEYNFTFSDYGKTTVEIPEEYTYEKYTANHNN